MQRTAWNFETNFEEFEETPAPDHLAGHLFRANGGNDASFKETEEAVYEGSPAVEPSRNCVDFEGMGIRRAKSGENNRINVDEGGLLLYCHAFHYCTALLGCIAGLLPQIRPDILATCGIILSESSPPVRTRHPREPSFTPLDHVGSATKPTAVFAIPHQAD